jgi:hypothetical protein
MNQDHEVFTEKVDVQVQVEKGERAIVKDHRLVFLLTIGAAIAISIYLWIASGTILLFVYGLILLYPIGLGLFGIITDP